MVAAVDGRRRGDGATAGPGLSVDSFVRVGGRATRARGCPSTHLLPHLPRTVPFDGRVLLAARAAAAAALAGAAAARLATGRNDIAALELVRMVKGVLWAGGRLCVVWGPGGAGGAGEKKVGKRGAVAFRVCLNGVRRRGCLGVGSSWIVGWWWVGGSSAQTAADGGRIASILE